LNAQRASATAEAMALFRAIESSRPADKRLFEDRFAPLFLRPALHVLPTLNRFLLLRRVIPWFIDSRWPGALSAGIARTRYIDDLVCAALADGFEQIVILGSGYDCRAYRIPGIERTRVFEIDQPGTLDAKRQRLQSVFPTLPAHVTFVATDFNQRRLEEVMAREKFDPSRPTLFLWEGVTNYLTEQAIDSTLRWFATAASGSRIVFTYVHKRVLEAPETFPGALKVFRALERNGEPWTFGLLPENVPRYLAERGMVLEKDLGAADFRKIYFDPQPHLPVGYEFYRIVEARVGNDSSRRTTMT
jgi:methyltransferase (TIGR00027 family)